MPDNCYWCGAAATSRDHVPPVNLFEKGKRDQLTTVPSCRMHNEDFHLLEERMRFHIQTACDSKEALAAFDGSTLRGLENPKSAKLVSKLFKGARPFVSQQGVTPQLAFPSTDYKLYFEKLARGLYYLNFDTQVEGDFFTAFRQSFIHHADTLAIFKLLAPHFNNLNLARQPSVPYPAIFRYRYVVGAQRDNFYFATIMQFYSDFEVIATFSREGVTE